jgi:hypothetical protein
MPDEADDSLTDEECTKRIAWFLRCAEQLENTPKDLPVLCPCCLSRTLAERSGYEICPVCFWEDDGQDDDADIVRGGPNGLPSLTQARVNYRRIGACEEAMLPHVRKPESDELP